MVFSSTKVVALPLVIITLAMMLAEARVVCAQAADRSGGPSQAEQRGRSERDAEECCCEQTKPRRYLCTVWRLFLIVLRTGLAAMVFYGCIELALTTWAAY